jgi:hypothetical protein
MANKVITARLNHDGKEYVGKRTIEIYTIDSAVDEKMVKCANKGLVLDEQSDIRQKLAEKYGLKEVKVGGKEVDTSDIEEV